MRAIFLDRDGTVNAGIPFHERVDSIDKVLLLPKAIEGLKILAKLNYKFFFVSNQAGIAEGLITMDEFNKINNEVLNQISTSGIKITQTFICPHGENATCECRKPKPKLLLDAAKEYSLDLINSWTVGDRLSDIQTGINAGTKTILVQTGTVKEAPSATFVAADLLDAAHFISKNS